MVPGFASRVISQSFSKVYLSEILSKIFSIEFGEKRLGVPPPKKIDGIILFFLIAEFETWSITA